MPVSLGTRILRAETSCNFFWGEAWVPRCHADLDEAWKIINSVYEGSAAD